MIKQIKTCLTVLHWYLSKESYFLLIFGYFMTQYSLSKFNLIRPRLHELFHPGMSFNPGWLSSHPGITLISVSGHLPVSVYIIWSKNAFAPGWFHPGLQHWDEIILGRTHFCSKSCKHSKVNDQTPRWKSSRDEIQVIPGWNSSRDEITHVNGA